VFVSATWGRDQAWLIYFLNTFTNRGGNALENILVVEWSRDH
jgi:hypothetical protein